MKKTLIVMAMAVALIALLAGTALAGSWWLVNTNAPNDVPDWNGANSEGLHWVADQIEWGAASTRAVPYYYRNNGDTVAEGSRTSVNGDTLSNGNPHGGFSTTTGYCKTCHAIHEAGEDSYRLLKSGDQDAGGTYSSDEASRTAGEGKIVGGSGVEAYSGFGTDRSNECMYCHDADAGFSPIRPYSLSVITTVRGEHTVGATHVPDAGVELKDRDPNDGDDDGVLQCYACHSVHGSDTMGTATTGNSKWGDKILRLDPNGDGTDMGQGGTGVPTVPTASTDAVKTAFCSDCHLKNSNWDTGSDDVPRPNPETHIQGPADDGLLEVYGETVTVAWDDYSLDGGNARGATEGYVESSGTGSGPHPTSPAAGCRGCHSADDHGNEQKDVAGLQSNWPHQSIGPKLLNDALGLPTVYGSTDSIVYSTENNPSGNDAGYVGDADRALINMDAICLRCHRDNKGGLITADTAGVGITF
jgi:hypothetical protein